MALAPSLPPSVPPTDACYGTDNADTVRAFVLLAAISLFLLHILGSLRQQSAHSFVHAIVMGINTLSYPLVSYTIGLMKSTDWYYDDFAVWAVFLLLLLGSTDNLTACRLSDIENWKGMLVKHLFKGFLLVYVTVTYARKIEDLLPPLSAIMLVGILKWYMRIASMRMVSKSYLWKNVKVIADYMEHEEMQLEAFNPMTMDGCQHVVAGEKYCGHDNLKVFTVERIWQCTGSLLLHERGNRLKDVCLSMALSKMLNLRFAGFKLSEAQHEKTRDFVFRGLLAGNQPYQRAFRVIEEELVFVHDSFYTRYYYFYRKSTYLALCLPIIMFGLCSWLTYNIVVSERRHSDQKMFNLTIFITVVLAFLEAYQLYLYIASGWFKVALISSYVSAPFLQRNGCYLEMIIGLVLRLKAFRPWKNKLGQYCIIRYLGLKSNARDCVHYATLRLVDKKRPKKWCKNSVQLSENLKEAIIDSLLRSNNGCLTNGITSLRKNEVEGHLSWACYATARADGSVTRTILVWHLATTLCEHQLDPNFSQEDNVITACTLSQYCMHLLAFAPHLLPDQISISGPLLDQTINNARQRITEAGAMTIEDRYYVLMNISTHDDDSPVAQGGKLARDLIRHIPEPTERWKVLSEFWAEMMLYVSPSDDARAHLEGLAKGGEFITHLWALLTHAGVLKRGSALPRDIV